MELRQTIRTGIRNIRRAWWEPGLMLALSALLVAARAIVDHMATLHKKNTLCPAHKALEGRPNMYIHFRTEDSYQVVALQVGGGQRRGVSYPRDGGGLALAAQVLQPQDLEAYVLAQIHGALREPVNGADQLGKAGECWYLLTDVGKIGMLRA